MTIVPYINRPAPFPLEPAIALLGNEKEGMAIDFVNMRAYVRDRGTPGNFFLGDPNDLLTYDMPSTKYVIDAKGVLVPGTTLRCDHLADGTPLGLLSEEERTNINADSENATGWFAGNGASPPALTGSTKLGFGDWNEYTTVGANPARIFMTTFLVSPGQTFAVSLFVDSDNSDHLEGSGIEFYFGRSSSQRAKVTIDPGTMAVNATGTVPGIVVLDGYEVVDMGSGVYRLVMICTAEESNSYTMGWWENTTTTGGKVRFTGMQIEEGPFPTSYIKTEGSQVTRAADVISLPTSRFPYSAEEGTVVADFRIADSVFDDAAARGQVWHFNDVGSNRLALRGMGAPPVNPSPSFVVGDGATNETVLFAGTSGTKIGAAWDGTGSSAVQDGGAVQTAGGFAGTSFPLFQIGSADGNLQLNGHIRSLVYIPRRISDVDLRTRTA